jgi:hypothetical protein
MVALVQAACGPLPEQTPGAELQAAQASSPLIGSEPRGSDATFDVSLLVGDKEQSAHIEVSPDALRALEAVQRLNANGRTSDGDVQLKSIVQERIQRAINEGKLQPSEGGESRIVVGARFEVTPTPEGAASVDVCVVPATITLWYQYYSYNPTCTYFLVADDYDGFYNQCDGSYYLVTYLGSQVYGPYSCG